LPEVSACARVFERHAQAQFRFLKRLHSTG
jgi:hypothetical protein